MVPLRRGLAGLICVATATNAVALTKRWPGWDTTTLTSYVTDPHQVPGAVTLYTTFGESPSAINGGTTTETVYAGADTVTVQAPQTVVITIYPTTTTYSTSRVTVPTSTRTTTAHGTSPTRGSSGGGGPRENDVCLPGDADVKETTGLRPTHIQSIMLYVIAIYIVGIGIAWGLIGLNIALHPAKKLTIATHELGHLLACLCFNGYVKAVDIEPRIGGATRCAVDPTLSADETIDEAYPIPALPFGFLFSILFGGIYTFCSFNILASKIASFIIGLSFAGLFLYPSGVPDRILILCHLGLMTGLWWVNNADGLRYYVLLIGVMSSFFVLYDHLDASFSASRIYPSCCTFHSRRLGFLPLTAGHYVMIYLGASFLFFVGFVLAALAAWKQTPHAMYCQGQTFLPT